MQVRYTLTKTDLKAYQKALLRGPLRWLQAINITLLVAFVGFSLYSINRLNAIVAMEIIGAFYAYLLLRLLFVRLFKSSLDIAEPDLTDVETTVTIDPVGVTFSTYRRISRYAWSFFVGTETVKGYFLILQKPYRAHFIPLRAFYDERQAIEFTAQAEAYRLAALSGPQPALERLALGAGLSPAVAGLARAAGDGVISGASATEGAEAVWPPRPKLR